MIVSNDTWDQYRWACSWSLPKSGADRAAFCGIRGAKSRTLCTEKGCGRIVHKKNEKFFYLASRFGRREEVRRYRKEIIDMGYACNCRWLCDEYLHIEKNDDLQENDFLFNIRLATEDLQDIEACDVFVFFPPGGERGGCHAEFGYALALGKYMCWIGVRQHVFSYLPEVKCFESFEMAKKSHFGLKGLI